MYKKEVTVCRYQQTYMNTPKIDKNHLNKHSYMYSGYKDTNIDKIPDIFQVYYKYISSLYNVNQLIINWYDDENDYISPHSDCTRGIDITHPIIIISLYENDDDYRNMIMENKREFEYSNKISIPLYNNSILCITYEINYNYTHGIYPSLTKKGKRISLSFRNCVL